MIRLMQFRIVLVLAASLAGWTGVAASDDDHAPAAAPASHAANDANSTANNAATLAPGWSAAPFQLNDGTPVRLRLADNLTSGTEAVGQAVHFEVEDEVRVSNVTIIPKGAPALGTVSEVSGQRSRWQPGTLKIAFESVALRTGERAPLRASGAPGEKVVALADFSKQGPITEGALVTAYLDGDFGLDVSKLGIVPAVQPPAVKPAAAKAAAPAPAAKKKVTRPVRKRPRPATQQAGDRKQ